MKIKNNFQNNVIQQKNSITHVLCKKKYGYMFIVIWFTGLSGLEKYTIANFLEKILFRNGINTYLLDRDNIKLGLHSDLSFSITDREENIRRIREVVQLMLDASLIILVSVIAFYRYQRKIICQMLGKENFLEIFIDTPISICQNSDPKKLYKKATLGQISDFTSIHSVYEILEKPDLLLNSTDSLEKNSKKNN